MNLIPVESVPGIWLTSTDVDKWCREHDATPNNVEDPRFGSLKSWPRAAWLAVYGVDLRKLF